MHRQNKLIFKFPVNAEVAFVSYAGLTVSYCCIGHYVVYFSFQYNKSPIWRLFHSTNDFARNVLQTLITYRLL